MTDNLRKPLVGGNWKMHLNRAQAEHLCAELSYGPTGTDPADVVLFPSFPLIPIVSRTLTGLIATHIEVGGQDIHPAEKGAHTGDVSGSQLVDAGCTWVLCGHSERRADHGESDELVGEKAAAASANGLRPLICVGETGDERAAGRTFEVLERQLTAALRPRPTGWALAYEPVWAIGTGETATPEIAQEAHAFLRQTIADLVGDETASVTRILYGGSVNPGNADVLISQPDLDGFLVGGASLDAAKFLPVLQACDRLATAT